jgi:hypothetical protein
VAILSALLTLGSAIAGAVSAIARVLNRQSEERAGAAEAALDAANRALDREKTRAQIEMEVDGLSSDDLSRELRDGPGPRP